jgi:hypothetical protein
MSAIRSEIDREIGLAPSMGLNPYCATISSCSGAPSPIPELLVCYWAARRIDGDAGDLSQDHSVQVSNQLRSSGKDDKTDWNIDFMTQGFRHSSKPGREGNSTQLRNLVEAMRSIP